MRWNQWKYVASGLVLTTLLAFADREVNSLADLTRLENVPAMILYTVLFSVAIRTLVLLVRPRS